MKFSVIWIKFSPSISECSVLCSLVNETSIRWFRVLQISYSTVRPALIKHDSLLMRTLAVLKEDFRAAYDIYIKHYPLSESHHRTQLKTNPAYQTFVQAASVDPRIRKRDLITFLSRPVTRLPRLNLLLEQIHKLTYQDNDHPDLDALPIITGILSDFIKSTQPGIEAAENKVKFWALCESLVFRRGEIIVCVSLSI